MGKTIFLLHTEHPLSLVIICYWPPYQSDHWLFGPSCEKPCRHLSLNPTVPSTWSSEYRCFTTIDRFYSGKYITAIRCP